MVDLPNRHAHRIAVAKGLITYTPPKPLGTTIPVVNMAKEGGSSSTDQASTGARSEKLDPAPSLSTLTSTDEDVSSAHSKISTEPSSNSTTSAFAQGWKAAMHQTQAERPPAWSDVDRFALDITETLDDQLAKGKKLNQTGVPRRPEQSGMELYFPALFRSICICDVNYMGHPVALYSRHFYLSPRGLKVGKAQFLNLPRELKHTCHLSARQGPDRKIQYVLEYSNELVSAEGEKAPYVLATQMDVSKSIASIAEVLNAKFWMGRNTHASTSHAARDEQSSEAAESLDADWCQIAREQPETRKAYENFRAAKDELILGDSNVLEFCEMVEDIRYFHKEYFTLTMGQEATGPAWKINYISPHLKSKLDDVKASFSHTGPVAMLKLGEVLSGERAASVMIKWGANAEPKRLYCLPMFRQVITCWICFLLKEEVGDMWDLEYSSIPSP